MPLVLYVFLSTFKSKLTRNKGIHSQHIDSDIHSESQVQEFNRIL
jgi:hypothetical protein